MKGTNGKKNAIPKKINTDKVSISLRLALNTGTPVEVIPVVVGLRSPEQISIVNELDLAIGRGEITSESDFRTSRKAILARRSKEILALQEKLINSMKGTKATVLWRYKHMPTLEFLIPRAEVRLLEGNNLVSSIDARTQSIDKVVDGSQMIDGTQISQFINDSYDGDNYFPQLFVGWAVIELGGANYSHQVFLDYSSTTSSRIRDTLNCTGSGFNASCISGTWTNPGSHATAVSGIIGGDIRDFQDPNFTSFNDRIARSGYAGESRGYIYRANYGTTRYDRVSAAYDDIIGRNDVSISNQSNGMNWNTNAPGGDTNCTGRTAFSRAVNAVFEAGILPVVAAGNEGAQSTGCTLTNPATALGAFTVGGHGTNPNSDNEADVRNGVLYGGSSRGPQYGRRMVDLTAYAYRRLLPDTVGGYAVGNTGNGGTSYSAPVVVSGAVDFITFYKDKYSNYIDNPAVLAANLLLMGDRNGTTGPMVSGFDRTWGAGRFKMRKFDSKGLDNPYGYKTGSVCVDHHTTVEISINGGNVLNGDIDYIKVVAFWYDQRHDDYAISFMDDIDLRLKKTNNTTLRSSASSSNNKERVFYSDPGGSAVKLELYGYNVTADNAGCGTNSMRVYYSVLYEDNDRDDSTGLTGIDSEF